VPSAEFALPSSPDGVETLAVLARRQHVEFVVGLLGKLEDVVGNGQAVVLVVEDGEKVVRGDAGTWGVGNEEGAAGVVRGCEGVHVKIAFTLVVWPGRLNDHNSALDDGNRDGTVAQHGGSEGLFEKKRGGLCSQGVW